MIFVSKFLNDEFSILKSLIQSLIQYLTFDIDELKIRKH